MANAGRSPNIVPANRRLLRCVDLGRLFYSFLLAAWTGDKSGDRSALKLLLDALDDRAGLAHMLMVHWTV
jgi:hypothetical protein